MGALLSIPLAGGLTTIGSSCLAGLAFCFTSTAGTLYSAPFFFLYIRAKEICWR